MKACRPRPRPRPRCCWGWGSASEMLRGKRKKKQHLVGCIVSNCIVLYERAINRDQSFIVKEGVKG